MILHVLFLATLLLPTSPLCPSSCHCSSKTLPCQLCLSQLYQTFNLTTQDCNCFHNFEKYNGGGDICCPSNCYKCYHRGCAECQSNASIVWNNSHKFYNCICNHNFVRSQGRCLCMSHFNPEMYYYHLEEEICVECPEGCLCSERGCYFCENEARRLINENNHIKICQCLYPFVERHGVCGCPKDCYCQGRSVVSCSESAHRLYSYYYWNCQKPYQQVEGACLCLEPYEEIDIFGQLKCLCKSKKNYTEYYQAEGVCKKCGDMCTCDEKGCSKSVGQFRQIVSHSCQCTNRSVQVNNECACVSPFYKHENGTCQCLSDLFPEQYYASELLIGYCHRCPDGCKCNLTGCYECEEWAMRAIEHYFSTKMDGSQLNIFECSCIEGAAIKKDRCECMPRFYYNQTLKKCMCTKIYPTPLNPYDNLCPLCPELCKCNITGCFECHSSALRIISFQYVPTLDKSVFVCSCQKPLVELEGTCRCLFGQKYNETENSCTCTSPYYTRIIERAPYCACLAYENPDRYYFDRLYGLCTMCPEGCRCGSIGCYDCDKYTMRFIDSTYVVTMGYYRCPCYQNSLSTEDGDCTSCRNDSYFDGNGCIKCILCQTCNAHRCLSCFENMTLLNGKCVCDHKNLTNVEGQCMCALNTHLETTVLESDIIICQLCPVNCLTCRREAVQIRCLSCNTTGTNRLDHSKDGCQCAPYFVQNIIMQPYCCRVECQSCDENGCLSCPLFTSRTLVDNQCMCLFPFEQVPFLSPAMEEISISMFLMTSIRFNVVCRCAEGTYYMNETCLQCPPNCKKCQYRKSSNEIVCTKCREDVNRNISSTVCECLDGFMESVPMLRYCYARECMRVELSCQECSPLRMLSETKTCLCPIGLYMEKNFCFKCYMEGCQRCEAKNSCSLCDQTRNYYLSLNICVLVNQFQHLMSQTQDQGLVFQIRLNQTIEYKQFSMMYYEINSTKNESNKQVEIQIYKLQINNQNILALTVNNPIRTYYNTILSLSFILPSQPNVTTSNDNFLTINTKINHIISTHTLTKYDSPILVTIQNFVFILLLTAFLLAIFGYKHNQIIFYLQTTYFIGFLLDENHIQTTLALQKLQYLILKFKYQSIWNVIPNNYLQTSAGNFKWTVKDSNMFRVIDLILTLQLFNMITLTILICLVQKTLKMFKINTVLVQLKKKVFRALELVFKFCAYPLIFFSLQTLSNNHSLVYIAPQFKEACISISIFFIIFHIAFVICLYTFGGLSKFTKIQFLCSFIYVCIASLTSTLLFKSNIIWIIVISIILIMKDLSYFVSRTWFLRTQNHSQKLWSTLFSAPSSLEL